MLAFVIHNMAPIMFASLVVFLLLGYPVAFALAANGLFFGLIGIELGLFTPDFLQALPERVYGIMSNDVLLAGAQEPLPATPSHKYRRRSCRILLVPLVLPRHRIDLSVDEGEQHDDQSFPIRYRSSAVRCSGELRAGRRG